MNRLSYLGGQMVWVQGTIYSIVVHTSATWRLQLNDPCVAAMRPDIKVLWLLVIAFVIHEL